MNNFPFSEVFLILTSTPSLYCSCASVYKLVRVAHTTMQFPRLVLVIGGRRASGKDFFAETVIIPLLAKFCPSVHVVVRRISDATKREYASRVAPGDAGSTSIPDWRLLVTDRALRDQHRPALTAFYQAEKQRVPDYDRRCFEEACFGPVIHDHSGSSGVSGEIVLVTGVREGWGYARTSHPNGVVLVKLSASDATKTARGWKYDPKLDEDALESCCDRFFEWDAEIENNGSSGMQLIDAFVHQIVPVLVEKLLPIVPDFPKPGIDFTDVSRLLVCPLARQLITLFVKHRLQLRNESVDAAVVVSVQSSGYILGTLVAEALCLRHVQVRKDKKVPPPAVFLARGGGGSHISGMMLRTKNDEKEVLPAEEADSTDHCSSSNRSTNSSPTSEVLNASSDAPTPRPAVANPNEEVFGLPISDLPPGSRVLVVDDIVSSGSTLKEVLALLETKAGLKVVNAFCVLDFFQNRKAGALGGCEVVGVVRREGL